MKRIFSILALFISVSAFSQPIVGSDTKIHHSNADSTIVLSNEITVRTDTVSKKSGLIFLNNQIYVGNGVFFQPLSAYAPATGGGYLAIADTSGMLSLYLRTLNANATYGRLSTTNVWSAANLFTGLTSIGDSTTTEFTGGRYGYTSQSKIALTDFSNTSSVYWNNLGYITWNPTSYVSTQQISGAHGYVVKNGSIQANTLNGVSSNAFNNGSGNVNNLVALSAYYGNRGTGTITNAYGLRISQDVNTVSNPITNSYGIVIGQQLNAGVTNGWGIVQNGTGDINSFQGVTNFTNRVNVTASTNFPIFVDGSVAGQSIVRIRNTSTASGNVGASIRFDNSSSDAIISKTGSGYTTYKNIQAHDLNIYNENAGNISFTNDIANRNINFATGGSSTAQLTLFSTGNLALGGTTDNPTALLNLSSTTKGFLPPAMTTTQRNAISSPATGLRIYNTTTNTNDFYNGSAWVNIGSNQTGSTTTAGVASFTSGTASTTTGNGAVVVTGGIGVSGAGFFGGNINALAGVFSSTVSGLSFTSINDGANFAAQQATATGTHYFDFRNNSGGQRGYMGYLASSNNLEFRNIVNNADINIYTTGTGRVVSNTSITASSLIKSGGTSAQFLKADGSTDANNYAFDNLVVHLAGIETITGAKTLSALVTGTAGFNATGDGASFISKQATATGTHYFDFQNNSGGQRGYMGYLASSNNLEFRNSLTNADINIYTSGTGKVVANTTVTAPQFASTVQTLTDGATITFNANNGSNAAVTLAGNRTLAFSNVVAGSYYTLIVIQDATGGRTLTLPANSKVIGGGSGAVTLSSTASSVDLITFYYDGTIYYVTYGTNYN